ncbi:cupin domain-containing protein [Rhodovarius lipocyclicus]|uniref:cupin domain-containing protein n=1 Tax=Rhodovarius lipocyclicus TaxID=268410 RepID=UPI001357773E|nr:cupin domain-containing protein [Rhodovarius lipocyclicus]
MSPFTRAAAAPAGQGTIALGFGPHLIRLTAAQTGGTMGLFEASVPPGGGPPLHIHEREDELLQVVSGRFGFWCGEDYVEMDAGGCIALPRGIPHRFQNVGATDGTLLCFVTPGGFEGFFGAVGAAGEARVMEIAQQFGITFLLD